MNFWPFKKRDPFPPVDDGPNELIDRLLTGRLIRSANPYQLKRLKRELVLHYNSKRGLWHDRILPLPEAEKEN